MEVGDNDECVDLSWVNCWYPSGAVEWVHELSGKAPVTVLIFLSQKLLLLLTNFLLILLITWLKPCLSLLLRFHSQFQLLSSWQISKNGLDMTQEIYVVDFDEDLDISKGFGENIGFPMVLNGSGLFLMVPEIESVSVSESA